MLYEQTSDKTTQNMRMESGTVAEHDEHDEHDDKAEILEILNLYGFALDAHQWQLFDRIFTEDVIAEFGPAGNAWIGLANFKRSFAEFHARLDSHQHTMMGQVV